MCSTCSWSCFRLWHTQMNLLQKKEKLSKPYSTPSTLCACLFPIVGLLLMVTYFIVDATDESSLHWIEVKDAQPEYKLPASYYDHMYQLLVFEHMNQKDDYNANLSVHQYYRPDYFDTGQG
eukprot:333416_1